MFRSTELNDWTGRFLERLLESVDVDQIADFIENASESYIYRDDVLGMASEILDELEHVKFTIN